MTSLQLKQQLTSGKCATIAKTKCVQNAVKCSVDTKIDKEKQVEDEYMEPTKCDWCGKEYELSEGTNVMGDNLCPNCTSIYEEERDVY